jgi:hypothetical protein
MGKQKSAMHDHRQHPAQSTARNAKKPNPSYI